MYSCFSSNFVSEDFCYFISPGFVPEDSHFTPLHVLVLIALKVDPRQNFLPQYLTIILQAGGNINDLDAYYRTPLQSLMYNVSYKGQYSLLYYST